MQLKITTLFCLLLGIGTLHAQNSTLWTGQLNTDWTNPVNWNNGLPLPEKEAIIPTLNTDTPNYPIIRQDIDIDYVIKIAGTLTIESGRVKTSSELIVWRDGMLLNKGELYPNARFRLVGEMHNEGILVSNSPMEILGTYINKSFTKSYAPATYENTIVNKSGAVWEFIASPAFSFYTSTDGFEACSWVLLPDSYISNRMKTLAQKGLMVLSNGPNLRIEEHGDGWAIYCPQTDYEACLQGIVTGCAIPSNNFHDFETYWTGAETNDFATAANWTNGVPDFVYKGIIPAAPSSGRFPTINRPITLSNELINRGTLNVGATLTGIGDFKLINENRLISDALIVLPRFETRSPSIGLEMRMDSYFENRDTLKGKVLNYGQLVNKGKIISNGGENYGKWINEGRWEVVRDGFTNGIDQSLTPYAFGIITNKNILHNQSHFENASRFLNQPTAIVLQEASSYTAEFATSWQIENEGAMYFYNGGQLTTATNTGRINNSGQLEISGIGDTIPVLDKIATSQGSLLNYEHIGNKPTGHIRINGFAYFRNSYENVSEYNPNLQNDGRLEIGLDAYVLVASNSFTTNKGTITNRGVLELVKEYGNPEIGLFRTFGTFQNKKDATILHKALSIENLTPIFNESCARFITFTSDFIAANFKNTGILLYTNGAANLNVQGSGTAITCNLPNYEGCLQNVACGDEYENPNYWTGNTSQDWFDASNWSNGLPEVEQTAVVPANPEGERFPVLTERADLEYFIVNEGELTFNSITNILKNGLENKGTIQIMPDATLVQTGDSLKAITNYGTINNDGVLLLNGWLFNYENLYSNKKLVLGGYVYQQGRGQYHIPLGKLCNYNAFISSPNDSIQMLGDWQNYGTARINGHLEIVNGYITNHENLQLTESSSTRTRNELWYSSLSLDNRGVLEMQGRMNASSSRELLRNTGTIYVRPCALYEGGELQYEGTNARLENEGLVRNVSGAKHNSYYLDKGGIILNCPEDCNGIQDDNIQVRTKNISILIGEDGVATLAANAVDNGSIAMNEACDYNYIRLEVEPNIFSCTDAGTQTVTLTAYDIYENFNTETAEVSVMPAENCGASAIEITCQTNNASNDSYILVQNHPEGYQYTLPTAYAYTECPSDGLRIAQISGPVFEEEDIIPVGTHLITYEANDDCGNSATCDMRIIVSPREVFFNCPDDITVRVMPDEMGAIVDYPSPIMEAYCGRYFDRNAVYSPALPSGSVFPIGTTSVTIDYMDYCNNSYQCSFDVHVLPVEIEDGVDVELRLSVDHTMPGLYTNATFELIAINTGTEDATNLIIDFPISEMLAYAGSSTTNGAYKVGAKQWQIPRLASGEFAELELTLYVRERIENLPVFVQVVGLDQVDNDSTPNNAECCTPLEDDEALVTLLARTGTNANLASPTEETKPVHQLFPSPTTELLNLHTTIASPYEVKIWTAAGQLLQHLYTEEGTFEEQFDVRSYEAGLYFMTIESESSYEVQRFVKQ